MDPNEPQPAQTGWLDRFRQSWFPPAAIVGAFAAFTAAAWRSRPAPPRPQPAPKAPEVPLPDLARSYALALTVGGATSARPFRRSLDGVTAGADDRMVALGDGEVRVFETDGTPAGAWTAPDGAACLSAGPDGRIYVGSLGRVDVFETDGRRLGGFAVGEAGTPAAVTAVEAVGDEVLVADAHARFIRRYDRDGRPTGTIGNQNKTRGFILPNRWLDFAVDASGVVRATDTGRHRVAAWALDGTPLGFFGAFSQRDPVGFVGCCNPVNVAVTPDGKVVTAEKMIARVKVYEPDGTLVALIGPEQFDQQATHLHLDVDSQGRILVADPVRREVKVFTWS